MESFKIENLSFTYPNREKAALCDINLTIGQGEFVTLCGKSGCGKTTLLRLLKSSLSPFGTISGSIFFENRQLWEVNLGEQASKIGFVMQSPENQIVTDKVWHELAFGLESLGYKTSEIRAKVSEMASFFGIQTWFHKDVCQLSGGQKQLLNLASVMVMEPSVLILDEPTSQLDPIAALEFLKTLEKINKEIGTTVILSEHRLEDAFCISDRVVVMDEGRIIADSTPRSVGEILMEKNHDMYQALPAPVRIFGAVGGSGECPLTVREGRAWLEAYADTNKLDCDAIGKDDKRAEITKTHIELKDVWFRYEKELPDVIKGLNIKIGRGEMFAIVGGNGTGKTTALSLISGLYKPYRGEVYINGEKISKIENLYTELLGVLPQNPQSLFVKKTVYDDLMEIFAEEKISTAKKQERVKEVSHMCQVENLLSFHPYDLSGGEQQRVALAKILLKSPQILLLDEPTKGLDAHFKQILADILDKLKQNGVTIVMVSHDIEFCAGFADRCAMFFDGKLACVDSPRKFFAGKKFYTTTTNRMARTRLSDAVLVDDVILACGGKLAKKQTIQGEKNTFLSNASKCEEESSKKRKKPLAKIIAGCIFALLFIITTISGAVNENFLNIEPIENVNINLLQIVLIVEIIAAFLCFFSKNEDNVCDLLYQRKKRKLSKRTLFLEILILLLIPFTIYIGLFLLHDRKYYFTGLFVALETIILFCTMFEGRKPRARELVIISVLCALAISGRAAFFMLPQFKPTIALVIISGICFGGEVGFLVGAITGFVSNFFFGQGPWTIWQMFAGGIVGFLGGVFFERGFLPKTKSAICIFGGLSTFFIYGVIMNVASVIMWQAQPTSSMIIAACILGIQFDAIHAFSTVFFLWFIAKPMIDKLTRIKEKYGVMY